MMKVKTFHDIYHSSRGQELDKTAAAELQEYLLDKTLTNYQISHTIERDEYGRLCTHILLVHE